MHDDFNLIITLPRKWLLCLASFSAEIEDAIVSGKIGSVIALGGGHSIQSSLANLRQFYELGVRALQLTDDCDTPW